MPVSKMSNPVDRATLVELLIYDLFTGKLYWKQRSRDLFSTQRAWATWNSRYAGTEAFTSIKEDGYLLGGIFNRTYRAHRVIWCMCFGYWPDNVDHEDGNRQNNSFVNLRDVSKLQNNQNCAISSKNKTGITGVYWNNTEECWVAEIGKNYKNIRLGRFSVLSEAIAARKLAEIEIGFHPNHGRR